ncbi:MAG: TonB-dependent receptor [Paludibacteraceae bacterium]|nr:TonB-dependent receptor [Paludibacteraceae bacterium]
MKLHRFCLNLIVLAALPLWATEAQDSLRTIALQEVVATGTRTTTDPRLLPVTVNVVSEEVLTEKLQPNILPTLTEQVPGLFITQRGVLGYGVSTGGSGGIKVRGIGGQPNTDVLVLIDGLPQYAGLYGHPIADNYQTSMAERVEVIRGPASHYYGSNALGGVINIVTRQPQSDTILTRFHAQGGSFGSVDAGITHQLRRGQWTEAVGFNYVRTSGHRENMAFDQYSGFARLGYDINSHWALNATGNIAYFNTANPGTVSDPIFDSHQHILRGMATLSAENRYDRTEGAVRAYYSGGRHRINDGHKAGEPLPKTEYNHTDLMLGVSAYQTVRLFRRNHTTFGFDYQHFGGHVWNKGLSDEVPSTKDIIRNTQYELAGYVDFRQEVVSWFSLDAGVRLGWHSVAGFYYAPQAGLSFLLPHDAQLKAVVSRGFRNPTIRELYMYAPANDSLQAVSLWNYELSYKQYLLDGRIRLGANIFYLHAKNMIETRPFDGRPRNVNTGELKNAGAEVEFSARVWQGLMVGANYSYLYMANPVLAAPEHKLNISLAYHHDRFRIGTNIQYIHGLYTQLPATGDQGRQQNFCLWSAHAAGRLWRELWLTLTADNILGTEYEINAGFPMPRTTVMAGLQFAF